MIIAVLSNRIRSLSFQSIIVALFLIAINSSAQDIHFSQFYESPLMLNPALCGQFNGSFYGEINYRTQWSSIMGGGNGFNTMNATAEFHNLLKNWKRGYISQGLSFYNDKSGDTKIGTTEMLFTLASGIFINKQNTISAGLQAGWAQRSIDLENAQWGEQYVNGNYDADAPTGESALGSSFSYMDFSGGISYSYNSGYITMTSNNILKANLGFAAFHINQPNVSFYGEDGSGNQLYMRYDAHGYLEVGIKRTKVCIEPGFSYYMQGPSTELNTGITARYFMLRETDNSEKSANSFDMGLYYRWDDSFIILLGMRLKTYTLGISYDINTSPLQVASSGRGALELSLKYVR